MKQFTFLINLFLLLSVFNIAQGQQIPPDPKLRSGKLSNGLTYYLRPNNTPKGLADFYIVQKVGSILEEENQRGLAHFLEHMAFNGTQHFPGNSMVQELEKKGIRFGSNINAYTSYDETVYNLTNVNVNREGTIDTALLVLHDWSGKIINNDKDIEDERGVIREEWRTRSSGYLRVQENEILPVLFAGTAYANRLPIGTLDVINNFKPEVLREYYKKWYRPDLQAIIVVGDFDVDKVEAKIKKLFSDIPAPVNPAPRVYTQIPDNDQPIVAIASDPEIQSATAKIYWKQDNISDEQRISKQAFKMKIVHDMISNMFNERLSNIYSKKNAAFQSAIMIMGDYSMAFTRPAWNLSVSPTADSNLFKALRAVLTETERMRRFGFSQNEFEPTIKNFNLSENEREYYDRNIKPTYQFPREYQQQFLRNEPSIDAEWKYRVTKEILTGLTMDTLNFYARQYLDDRNMAFEIVYPQKKEIILPTASEIVAIWREVRQAESKPWVKVVEPSDLSKLKDPKPGKIVKTEKNSEPLGYTKWTLSNGVKVWYRDTKYPEYDVYINGYKPGGYSLVSEKDLPSALAYNSVSAKAPGLSGFDGRVQSFCSLEKNQVSLSAKSSVVDVKLMLQNVYLRMTTYNKDQVIFDNWIASSRDNLKSRSVNPKVDYGDTLVSIMSNNHPRAISLNKSDILEKVDFETISRLHKERFGNARDFTFIINGNIQEESIRSLVETWLGSLPSRKKKETIKDHGIYPPKGRVKKHFTKKMETPQSTITVAYTGEIPGTLENQLLMGLTGEILRTAYLQEIREKEGGSYGVAVSGQLSFEPKERYIFQVNFDTDPSPLKKEKLISIVYNEINSLMENGPDQKLVDKVKTNFLKNHKESRKREDALYWGSISSTYYQTGIDRRSNFEKTLSLITPEMIQTFAKEIFRQGNLIEVVMDPEKKQLP